MTRLLLILFLIALDAPAQTITVCDVLEQLSNLNGKELSVRGSLVFGDTGQALLAIPPCDNPTVRDGWVWRDAIAVYPAGDHAAPGRLLGRYFTIRRSNPHAKIVATLTGRLETRSHFDVKTLGSGVARPIGYGDFVAILHYRRIGDIEAIPFPFGEEEQFSGMGRDPHAKRAQ